MKVLLKKVKLAEWEKDKHVLLRMMGQLAVWAETCFEVLKLAKVGERIRDLPPSLKTSEWVLLYRNRRRMLIGMIKEIRKLEQAGESIGTDLRDVAHNYHICCLPRKFSLFLQWLKLPLTIPPGIPAIGIPTAMPVYC